MQLCEAWQWKQANGALRDMVCRGLLLMLHRAGEIELPPVKRVVRNRFAERAAARARDPRQSSGARTTGQHHCRWSLCKCGARRKRRCSTA